MPEDRVISGVSIFVGFLVGLLVGGVCMALAIWLGEMMSPRSGWIFPLMDGALIVLSGIVALLYYRNSGIARGVVLALGVIFLLNGVCGLALMR